MDRCTLGRLLQQQPTKLKNLEDFEFDKKSPPLKGRNIIWSPTLQSFVQIFKMLGPGLGATMNFSQIFGVQDVKTLHLSERTKKTLDVPVMESFI